MPRKTVLVVDDDPQNRNFVVSLLECCTDVRVLSANTPIEAIHIAAPGETIDLLLSDVEMPEMSGAVLGNILTGRRPGLRVILMSGSSRPELLPDGCIFIQKPFTCRVLLDAIQEVLGTSLLHSDL